MTVRAKGLDVHYEACHGIDCPCYYDGYRDGEAAAAPSITGHACTECGASVAFCDEHIRARGRGCCGSCYIRDTHGLLVRGKEVSS